MIKTGNRQYIKDIAYQTADDFLHDISYGGELYKLFERNFIFRGHSSDKYKLQPYALRERLYYKKHGIKKEKDDKQQIVIEGSEISQVATEYQLLEEFFRMCDENQLYIPEVNRMREIMPWRNSQGVSFFMDEGVWLPKELYELATLAQHHGVPTRLLDWTQDIVIALYFVVSGAIQRKFNPKKLTYLEWQKEFTERLSKIKESISTKKLTNFEEKHNIEIWALDTFVRFQCVKDNPLRIIHPRYHDNGNLGAQKGILTLWETKKPLKIDKENGIKPELKLWEPKTLDVEISDFLAVNNEPAQPYLYHITVPESEVLPLYKYAKRYECDAAHLFPGYDGVVRCLQEDDMANLLSNDGNNHK